MTADLCGQPFPDDSFDVGTALEVLEHASGALRGAAGGVGKYLTSFYIFAIFSLFRSCRFCVLAALAYLYVLDDSAEAVLFYRKICFHADRQKSVKI